MKVLGDISPDVLPGVLALDWTLMEGR